jgi:hypothetical protein
MEAYLNHRHCGSATTRCTICARFFAVKLLFVCRLILAFFFGLVVSGQLVLAFGLYYGKKWGWILAVISSASISLISISALGASLINGEFINAQLWTLGLILGLLVSLTILFYLLSLKVRQFFGFVNPVEQPQGEPTEDKPQ